MRKIAIISEHASPLAMAGSVDSGGQNIYVAHVAKQLAAQGHCVDVFTRLDNPLLPTILKWQRNVRVVHVPAGPARHLPKEELLQYMPQFSTFLDEFFARERVPYDVVHANFFMSGKAALPVARRYNVPLVMTFHALGKVRRQHQGEADRFPDTRFEIEDELVAQCDRIVAECPQDARDLVELYCADESRIDIVPCGFDAEELHPIDQDDARQELGWPAHVFTILQLGRLVPRKGVDNVVRSVGALKRRHGFKARLCIVGGNSSEPNEAATPEIGRLRRLAEREGIANQVVFCGRQSRQSIGRFYAASDVFVTTPWYEPFGITPVEAMACARPVIGARVGGIQYTVEDGVTGYLVPPDDHDQLADRLAALASNPSLASAMGEAGHRRAQALFTWSKVAQDLFTVYEKSMGSDTSPSLPRPALPDSDGLRAIA